MRAVESMVRGVPFWLDVRQSVRYNVAKGVKMTTISATEARKDIYNLMDKVNSEEDPVLITKKDGNNAMMISEKKWDSIKETLYLLSIPGLSEDLMESKKLALSEYEDITGGIDWDDV